MLVDPRKGISHAAAMRIATVLRDLWDQTPQKDVAAHLTGAGLPTDQTKVSAWLRGRVPNVEQLNAIEAAYGKPSGWVLASAGFIDCAGILATRDDGVERLERTLAQLRAARERAGEPLDQPSPREPRSDRTRRAR